MHGQCAVSDGKSLGALVVGRCSCLVKIGDGGGRRVPVAWVIMASWRGPARNKQWHFSFN
jgi:hypothetical protein